MRRDVFSEEHEVFRSEFRRFAESELAPRVEKWNADGITDFLLTGSDVAHVVAGTEIETAED